MGRSAGAAESSAAKQEAAGLADHQLQACGECDALRQQLANEQVIFDKVPRQHIWPHLQSLVSWAMMTHWQSQRSHRML